MHAGSVTSDAQVAAQKEAINPKAAKGAIQTHFPELVKQLKPQVVAPPLFGEKIIDDATVEKMINQLYPKEERAQELLLELMNKVEARPDWFNTICEIFERKSVLGIEKLRGKLKEVKMRSPSL